MNRGHIAAVAIACGLALTGCSAGGSAPVKTVTATPSATAASPNPKATYGKDFKGTPGQFTIGVTVLRKKCFGSAGCNVTYRIEPKYVGPEHMPSTGTVEVTYKVMGAKSEIVNTFTIKGSQASFPSEETTETATEADVLTAEATAVNYQP